MGELATEFMSKRLTYIGQHMGTWVYGYMLGTRVAQNISQFFFLWKAQTDAMQFSYDKFHFCGGFTVCEMCLC